MAYQLSDLITKVQRRIRDTGYSTIEITDYLNDAQNDVFNEYNLPFVQTSQNYTLTVNNSDITSGSGLPANFVQAVDLTLTTEGKENQLQYISYEELAQFAPDPDDTTRYPANTPQYWYTYDEVIRVYPCPNQAYTVTLRYFKKPTNLVSSTDVPTVPAQFEELLVLGAAYRVLQVKDNYDQASILQNKYDELLQKLVVRYSVNQTGRALRIRKNFNASPKRYF